MMQPNSLLNKSFAGQRGVTRLDANRSSSANAVEELVTVVDRLHAEFGQYPAVKGPGEVEPAHSENDMGHPIDLDHVVVLVRLLP